MFDKIHPFITFQIQSILYISVSGSVDDSQKPKTVSEPCVRSPAQDTLNHIFTDLEIFMGQVAAAEAINEAKNSKKKMKKKKKKKKKNKGEVESLRRRISVLSRVFVFHSVT